MIGAGGRDWQQLSNLSVMLRGQLLSPCCIVHMCRDREGGRGARPRYLDLRAVELNHHLLLQYPARWSNGGESLLPSHLLSSSWQRGSSRI